MSTERRDEFDTAKAILWDYYDLLMHHMAEDVIRNQEEFKKGPFGDADEILKKNLERIHRISSAYAYVRSFSKKEKPRGEARFAADEFRCFDCGAVIRQHDQNCMLCGWTWR